jgi:hypothetical protein
MSHLVIHMLSKSHPRHITTNFLQKQPNPRKKVTEGLIIHHPKSHGLSNGHRRQILLSRLLNPFWQEHAFQIFNFFKARMIFILWIDEMFDFGHEEFSYAKETGTRRDFVTEGFSDGSTCEWHTRIIEFEEFIEIEELTLCCFGTEISFLIPRRTDGGIKHQIEFDGRFKGSSSLWIDDIFIDYDFAEFCTRVIVDLG